jgi:hypothetical protein
MNLHTINATLSPQYICIILSEEARRRAGKKGALQGSYLSVGQCQTHCHLFEFVLWPLKLGASKLTRQAKK